uniref:Uncharacterized protein n=1 Tax=Fagus sylvatica TaxID=28930 RepID=A0A2N9FAB6_FAGSY
MRGDKNMKTRLTLVSLFVLITAATAAKTKVFAFEGTASQPREIQDMSQSGIRTINSQVFQKEIADQGITWLLLSYTPTLKGYQHIESIIEEVGSIMRGALQVGSINCETEPSFCKDLGIYPRRVPRVFIYSYVASDKGSLVEYNGDLAVF